MGDKTAGDLVTADTIIEASGEVNGMLKYVKGWTEFYPDNPEEQSGNYFPVKLDEKYIGKPITVKKNGVTVKTDTDIEWVIRIPDKNTTVTFKDGDTEIITLNFKQTKFESAATIKAVETVKVAKKTTRAQK